MSITPSPHPHPVGPVLIAGAPSRAIIEAIRAENAGVEIVDRGSYLRVLVPGRCRVSRAAIEAAAGHPFELPRDLERVMSSFKGHFAVTSEEATWGPTAHHRRP